MKKKENSSISLHRLCVLSRAESVCIQTRIKLHRIFGPSREEVFQTVVGFGAEIGVHFVGKELWGSVESHHVRCPQNAYPVVRLGVAASSVPLLEANQTMPLKDVCVILIDLQTGSWDSELWVVTQCGKVLLIGAARKGLITEEISNCQRLLIFKGEYHKIPA